MVASADKLAKGLPTAQEMMEKLALAEAEKASEEARKHAATEAEKKALLDKLTKPSGGVPRGGLEARRDHRRARGRKRPDRGAGLSLSQCTLY